MTGQRCAIQFHNLSSATTCSIALASYGPATSMSNTRRPAPLNSSKIRLVVVSYRRAAAPCSRITVGRCSASVRAGAGQHLLLGALDVDLDQSRPVPGGQRLIQRFGPQLEWLSLGRVSIGREQPATGGRSRAR